MVLQANILWASRSSFSSSPSELLAPATLIRRTMLSILWYFLHMPPVACCCSVAKSCPTPSTPWTAGRQASLSFTMSWSFPGSCPLHHWCHPTVASSATLFSFCLQSFPASGSFPVSQLFVSEGQNVAYFPDSQARLSAPWQWDHVLCISAFPRSVTVPGT